MSAPVENKTHVIINCKFFQNEPNFKVSEFQGRIVKKLIEHNVQKGFLHLICYCAYRIIDAFIQFHLYDRKNASNQMDDRKNTSNQKYKEYMLHRAHVAQMQLVKISTEDDIEAEIDYERQKLLAQIKAHPQKKAQLKEMLKALENDKQQGHQKVQFVRESLKTAMQMQTLWNRIIFLKQEIGKIDLKNDPNLNDKISPLLTLSDNPDWQQAFANYKSIEYACDIFVQLIDTQFNELQSQQDLLIESKEKFLKQRLQDQYIFSKKALEKSQNRINEADKKTCEELVKNLFFKQNIEKKQSNDSEREKKRQDELSKSIFLALLQDELGTKKNLFFSKDEFTIPVQELDYFKEAFVRVEKRLVALQLKKLIAVYPFEKLHEEMGMKPGVFFSERDLQIPNDLLNPTISYESCIEILDDFFAEARIEEEPQPQPVVNPVNVDTENEPSKTQASSVEISPAQTQSENTKVETPILKVPSDEVQDSTLEKPKDPVKTEVTVNEPPTAPPFPQPTQSSEKNEAINEIAEEQPAEQEPGLLQKIVNAVSGKPNDLKKSIDKDPSPLRTSNDLNRSTDSIQTPLPELKNDEIAKLKKLPLSEDLFLKLKKFIEDQKDQAKEVEFFLKLKDWTKVGTWSRNKLSSTQFQTLINHLVTSVNEFEASVDSSNIDVLEKELDDLLKFITKDITKQLIESQKNDDIKDLTTKNTILACKFAFIETKKKSLLLKKSEA